MGAWPEREAPAEKFASASFTVEKGMDSSIPFSFSRLQQQTIRDSPEFRRLPGYGSSKFINKDVEGCLNMEPFAMKSGRRSKLHWWAVAGVAAAFFVWSFDLIPRVRSAASGTVAKTVANSDSARRQIDLDEPLDSDWSPRVSPLISTNASDAMDADDPLRDAFLTSDDPILKPPAVFDEADLHSSSIRNPNQSRPIHDAHVTAASYEKSPTADRTSSRTIPNNLVIPADIAESLRNVDEWFRDDQILDTHAELSRIYWKHPELRELIQERIDQTAAIIFTTSDRQFGPPHFVEYGETLESIAKQYNVPWAYLSLLNKVTPEKLQAGQELKVVRGPFGAVVDLDEFTLTVHAHGWYVNHYRIGTGRNDKTPLGAFTVEDKLENPTWYNPDGGVVEPDDPENPLGEYWLGLGNHIGIHGTNDPETIGQAASRGCIHLGDDDITEVFSLLSPGSKVLIRK